MNRQRSDLKEYLDELVNRYNRPGFIEDDPISIPHQFTKLQDIEISGFLAATLAWGQRKTILNKCNELLDFMDRSPHDFVLNYQEQDLAPFTRFVHRTFNPTDALYFVHFLRYFYSEHRSLEEAFYQGFSRNNRIEEALVHFHELFFSLPDYPARTRKHVATPARKSACKRLNMFLRWMVRQDDGGVDFGLWKRISPADLVCPCDLHVDRVARRFNLISRKQTDWLAALELTENLKRYDPADPVRYDFALYGLGLTERYPETTFQDFPSTAEG